MEKEMIIVLDFGGQYNQLIARRVRECNVYCEVHSYNMPLEQIKEMNPKGIIFTGGPNSVYGEDSASCPKEIFELGIPILGICYGAQLTAHLLGGKVATAPVSEYGKTEVEVDTDSKLFEGVSPKTICWMSHTDYISQPAPGFEIKATTPVCPVAAAENVEKGLYCVQFHPEVTHTVQGSVLLKRFVTDICHCKPDWVMGDYIAEAVEMIRKQTNGEEVILGLSCGVDNSVAAALIHRAIGDKLTCVFVDNGLLRKGEREQVRETFEKNMGLKLIVVDAVDRFMRELAGVTDPEQKRKIIGREFVNVFQEEAEKLSNAKWLAQGTIYPDVIESAGAKTKKAKTIKSHHNVGGLPETLHLKLLEPLRSLFKDEVRELGVELGLPYEMVYRHPFPGPGLGVRILGEVKREYADLLREADAIFIEELRRAGWYDKVSQAFVVFLPVKSVGVMGDGRTYDWVVSLRSVETSDFMTAKWSELPYSLLATVSNRIINEVKGINRVVYDVSGKPPATIEWE